eukprot:scaffold11655_cov85-Skeletonema_dohrnii-CCMP3373.AAC.1
MARGQKDTPFDSDWRKVIQSLFDKHPLPTHAYCRVLRSRMIDECIELQNEPRLALQVHLLAEI